VPAVLGTVALAFLLCFGIGWGVGIQIDELARSLPENQDKIKKKIAEVRGSGDGPFGKVFEMYRELVAEPTTLKSDDKLRDPGKKLETGDRDPGKKNEVGNNKGVVVVRQEEASGFDQLGHVLLPVLEPLATAGLIVVLVVFMLINREDLRNRLISLLGHGHLTGATRIIVDAAQRLSRFLLTQLLVNVGFGIVFGVGLLIIGVPYALLWGFLTAVLRFVPYVGTLFAVAFPAVLSFALSPDWGQLATVLVLFAVLELTTANAIEPLLIGHTTGVTPIALLVAAAFWTCVWGPIGLVLSTPLTLCLVVLGQHVPRFRVFALLLGDEPALEAHASYYQRLLARDEGEATQLVEQKVQASGIEKVCDDVLLPALVLARRDRKRGFLTPEDEAFIIETTRKILTRLGESAPPGMGQEAASDAAATTNAEPPAVLILGCPAHDEAEELVLHMLALIMRHDGCRIEIVSTRALPSEVEARVVNERPALVFIPILPPGGMVQARYLCTRMRKRARGLPLVIGCWSATSDFDRLLVRFRAAGASYVTTSLSQTRGQIRTLVCAAPPAVPPLKLEPAGAS
jgi:predicted PurR-regulated permease PerM